MFSVYLHVLRKINESNICIYPSFIPSISMANVPKNAQILMIFPKEFSLSKWYSSPQTERLSHPESSLSNYTIIVWFIPSLKHIIN